MPSFDLALILEKLALNFRNIDFLPYIILADIDMFSKHYLHVSFGEVVPEI